MLLPGVRASFVNYTSYTRGINGVMLDILNLTGTPTAADFVFRKGNTSKPYGNDLNNPADDWPMAPAPTSITVRDGAGVDGADRVTLIWADNAIQQCWLQVTVQATDVTGLAQRDVFYVGNAIGESGNNPGGDTYVNALDEVGARNNPHGRSNPAPIDDHYDYNRDKNVNALDEVAARNNPAGRSNSLVLFTPPANPAGGGGEGEGVGEGGGDGVHLGAVEFVAATTWRRLPMTLPVLFPVMRATEPQAEPVPPLAPARALSRSALETLQSPLASSMPTSVGRLRSRARVFCAHGRVCAGSGTAKRGWPVRMCGRAAAGGARR